MGRLGLAALALAAILSIGSVASAQTPVVDTRAPATIGSLDAAVVSASVASAALPNGNPYVNLGKAEVAKADVEHANAAAVVFYGEDDFDAALAAYKAYRYRQVSYHGRAAQYFGLAGTSAATAKSHCVNAKTYGNTDFNAP